MKVSTRKPKIDFALVQQNNEWFLQFDGSENLFPATDVEINLWLKVKELEEIIHEYKHNYSGFTGCGRKTRE